MGRTVLFGVVLCGVLLAAATTRSDVSGTDYIDPSSVDAPAADEQTAAVVGPSASASTAKDPFAPYDVGPPESIWPYESLTADEQALVDRGRDASDWRGAHDAFGAAVRERSQKARAEAAQHDLGLDTLDDVGVVP